MPRTFSLTAKRVGLSVATSVASACLVAGSLSAPANAATNTEQAAGGTRVVAKLNGSKEVPGPGDRNGSGRAVVRLKPAMGKVCARVSWNRIGDPVAAHIHRGRAGVSGDVVVDLTGSVTGGRNCAKAKKSLILKIALHPRRFYFNVHTKAYAGGAIRGQLR